MGQDEPRITQVLAKREQLLDRIVTGDISWFHNYEPEIKQQSRQWKRCDEPVLVKAKAKGPRLRGPQFSGIKKEYCF